MKHRLRRTALTLLVAAALVVFSTPLAAQEGVVRAVMFFSPTCPHCAEVIQDHLPIFFGTYGGEPTIYLDESLPENERCLYLFSNGQLEILLIDATRECGTSLYLASNVAQIIPPQRGGVPRFVMGEIVLVGAVEIPSRFHGLMREAQASGGLTWPAIPGLDSAVAGFPLRAAVAADSQATAITADVVGHEQADTTLAPDDATNPADVAGADTTAIDAADSAVTIETTLEQPQDTVATTVERRNDTSDNSVAADSDTTVSAAQATPGDSSPFDLIPDAKPTMLDNLRRDPAGNAVALIVLAGMVASVAAAFGRKPSEGANSKPRSAVLVVALLGIAVSGYLTYVETSGATAVCGPVGDCNTVQQSPYAMLFGLIPVGLLGLLGYATIVVAWFVWTHKPGVLADYAALTALGIALVGTLFSIYLTFLEPFIIGATCAWCIASSVAITILLLLTVDGGRGAWGRLAQGR